MSRKLGPLLPSDQKYCFSCQTAKTRTAFYVDRSKPDGRTHQCKECVKARRVAGEAAKARMGLLVERLRSRQPGTFALPDLDLTEALS